MEESGKNEQEKKKGIKVTTFPVPLALGAMKENITIHTNQPSPLTPEEIIHKANKLHSQGNISEAAKYYQYFINQGLKDHRVFTYYGGILKELGKLEEAELYLRKAVEINPCLAASHYNLGVILKDQYKLEESEIYTRKAIELQPEYAKAHANLGVLLRVLGKLKEAEIHLKKAIILEPSYEAYFSYASCLFEKKEFNSSIKNLEKAKALVNAKRFLLITNTSIAIVKEAKSKSINSNKIGCPKKVFDKKIDRLIMNREVENELVSYLLTVNTNPLHKTKDSRYGPGECSDFSLFNDPSPIISKLSNDIQKICRKELGLKEIFIFDSFFNIFISGSGQPPHRHLNLRDKNFDLLSKKYSLVYYLDVGDQDGEDPGILTLHEPEEEILPTKGMIVIIGADRYHSVVYRGNKKRIMIGVNFYGL